MAELYGACKHGLSLFRVPCSVMQSGKGCQREIIVGRDLQNTLKLCFGAVALASNRECLTKEHSDGSVPGIILKITRQDRKSTRLNSSHRTISYAVFCLKKKKKKKQNNKKTKQQKKKRKYQNKKDK